VAMNVNGTVITSSPGFTPAASSASVSASVPFPTPMQCAAPQNLANSRSKEATSSPRMNDVRDRTRAIAASISGLRLSYWALRSTSEMAVRLMVGVVLQSGGIDARLGVRVDEVRDLGDLTCGVAGDHGPGRHVPGHDAPRADEGVFADDHAGQEGRVRA